MSVFISWAEKESLSHQGALLLQKWLPEVLPTLESFVSSEDIASGALWLQKLFEQLEQSESGILCLTKETLNRNWILFEAGALAKRAGSETTRVCPLLFEFKSLSFPLAAFQAHSLNKDDETRSQKELLQLVRTLNKNRSAPVVLDDNQIERQFNRCWGEFWGPYVKLCEKHAKAKAPQTTVKVTNEEILAEMRGAFRQFADVLTEIRRGAALNVDQPAELQQFTVQCPFCQNGNEVLMPDRPGETKPTICSVCGSRFNAHMTGGHSVFVRPIASFSTIPSHLPTVLESIQCPFCQETFSTDLPEQRGTMRTLSCPKCNNMVHAHRNVTGGILVRRGGDYSGGEPGSSWWRFLSETQAWVEPSALVNLLKMTATVVEEQPAGATLTPENLCKGIFVHMDHAPLAGLSRSMVRIFVKIMFEGGVFQFPKDVEKITWRTAVLNRPRLTDMIRAYALGAVRRLRRKFVLTPAQMPELATFLFPVEMPEAQDSLRTALEQTENGKEIS